MNMQKKIYMMQFFSPPKDQLPK